MKIKNIIYNLASVIVLYFLVYISGPSAMMNYILFVFFYSIIFYILQFIWRKLRKRKISIFGEYILIFFKKISLAIIIIFLILGGFGYYNNEIKPANMPEITISNGEKTVIFQAMSHIGSQDFYTEIKNNLISAKNRGYVYFFEGVKPGKKENMEAFNKAIGVEFNEDLYKNFSKLYGVTHQDNAIYYNLVNNLDFNVDVSIDDIMEQYNKKPHPSPLLTGEGVAIENSSIDISSQIIKTLSELNEKELKLLVYINKSILNFLIKSDKLQSIITENFANKELFDIILNGRNEVLADGIIDSQYDKIYVTYGLMHFKGVFDLLKENDPNWKIITTNYLTPIQ